jgi:metallo-beta-lactamase family protein
MRIQFCGADRTVTGSSHLVEINGRRILLDLGMYQGPRQEAERLNRFLPDRVRNLDAVILSHGHLDHCGKLPMLTRAGYRGPIYCTPASAAVARIVLEDAAKIQEENVDYLNRRARGPGDALAQLLFARTDVAPTLRLFKTIPYGQRADLGAGVSFTFYDAGHILGSAYVIIEWTESRQGGSGATQRLLFTGDIGRYNTPILRDPHPVPTPVDYVITESTYGASRHGPITDVEPQFLDAVQYCVQHRSRLLIPSFAVGRTQTVLWYMQKFISEGRIPAIPIYVDSPMGVAVSEVHSQFRENYDDETNAMIGKKDLFGLSRVTFASTPEESRRINSDAGPCVIIASSPTCEFGRILHHLKQSVERPENMVVFVGWIPPGTLGRRLQQRQPRVRILDRWYDVRCQVRTIHGLSAHADADELVRFLTPALSPTTAVHVVHGEVSQAEVFAARLSQTFKLTDVSVPSLETSVLTPHGSGVEVPPVGAPPQQADAEG